DPVLRSYRLWLWWWPGTVVTPVGGLARESLLRDGRFRRLVEGPGMGGDPRGGPRASSSRHRRRFYVRKKPVTRKSQLVVPSGETPGGIGKWQVTIGWLACWRATPYSSD